MNSSEIRAAATKAAMQESENAGLTQYVLCFAHPREHAWWPEVLLIEKRRPRWMAGRYNLPGGHVEEGETPHQAASRELYEETAIDCPEEDIRLMGTIEGETFVVYVLDCPFESLRGKNVAQTTTSERVFWMPIQEAFRQERLMDHLRIIIPLVRSGLMGWSMLRQSTGFDGETIHTLSHTPESHENTESA